MPYALCPMPYAHEYLIFLRKAIHYHRSISGCGYMGLGIENDGWEGDKEVEALSPRQ